MELFLQLVKNGFVIGLLYALFAYGLSIIVATTGIWHFAHGVTFLVGAYTFWSLFEAAHLPAWAAVPGAFVAGALVGAATELVVYRPLRRLGASTMVLLVASLAFLTLAENLIPLVWGTDAKSVAPRPAMSATAHLGPLSVTSWDAWVVLSSVAVFGAVYWLQGHTRLGLSFRALGDNAERAQLLGIAVDGTFVWTCVIGSAVAVPTSILIAVHNPLLPGMGFELLLKAFTALIIGGVGSIGGALAGGLLIGLVENLAVWRLPTEWAQFALFAVLFALIVVRPQGLARLRARRA